MIETVDDIQMKEAMNIIQNCQTFNELIDFEDFEDNTHEGICDPKEEYIINRLVKLMTKSCSD